MDTNFGTPSRARLGLNLEVSSWLWRDVRIGFNGAKTMASKVAEELYSTQIMLVQKESKHSNEVYFREIDQLIYEWLRKELPKTALPAFDKEITFNDFHRKPCFIFRRGAQRLVASQVLETQKLICHGLTIRIPVASNFKDGVNDAYLETSLCIETSKIATDGCVHFSIAVWFIKEPIRDFYPSAPIDPRMPRIVNDILANPHTSGEFVQIIRDKEVYAEPLPVVRYPIDDNRPLTDENARRDFIAQLTDPLRPICLVVVFGRGWKCNYATRRLAAKLYSKACVYHIEDLTADLRETFRQAVPGIDLDRDFRDGVCRVFFPLGQYVPDDWANPTYRLKLFHINDVVQRVKKGCFASFHIGKLGWREDDYDVYDTKCKLQKERKEEAVIESALEEAEHRETCDGIIGGLKEDVKVLNLELMDAKTEIESLRASNQDLNSRISKMSSRIAAFEADRVDALANSGIKFPTELEAFTGEIREHVISAIENGRKGFTKKEYARKHRILEEVLKVNPRSDVLVSRHAEVKRILSTENRPDDGFFNALAKLGIVKVSEEKHYKVEFEGIPMTLAKTPSEWRGAKNAVSQMNNLYF